MPRSRCSAPGAALPVPRSRCRAPGAVLPVQRSRCRAPGAVLPVQCSRCSGLGAVVWVRAHRGAVRGASLLEHAAQVAVGLRVGGAQRQSRAVRTHRLALRAARRAPQPLGALPKLGASPLLHGTAALCAAGATVGPVAAARAQPGAEAGAQAGAEGEQELAGRRVELTAQQVGGRRVGGSLWRHRGAIRTRRAHGASGPAPRVRSTRRGPVLTHPARTARLRHGCGAAAVQRTVNTGRPP